MHAGAKKIALQGGENATSDAAAPEATTEDSDSTSSDTNSTVKGGEKSKSQAAAEDLMVAPSPTAKGC